MKRREESDRSKLLSAFDEIDKDLSKESGVNGGGDSATAPTTIPNPIPADVKLNFDEDTLDFTSNEFEIDVSEMDEDIKLFQQDTLVQRAIEQGVDLREYSKQIQQDLKQIEIESIDDYLEEAERLADLHAQLRSCDAVLEKMEQMLATFQSSLGDTAEEIKKLQDKSFTMHIQLNNRKNTVTSIKDFLQKIVIQPRLVSEINNNAVDDKYLSPILELDALLGNFEQMDRKIPAYYEVEPQLTSLTKTAVNKVRAFMDSKVKELGNSKSRDMGMQFSLLKYKYFYDFLEKYSAQHATNIRKSYINVIGSHYLNSFKSYIGSLQKRFPKAFASESVKNNTIVELSTFSLTNMTSSVTSFKLSSLSMSSMTNNVSSLWSNSDKTSKTEKFFDLGDRFEKIDKNSLISFDMPPQQAEQVDFTELWTSTFVLLTNTITSEYSFILDFFGQQQLLANGSASTNTTTNTTTTRSNAVTQEIFSLLFANSYSYLQSFTETYSSQTWDSVGVLLLIRKINDLKETMVKRDIEDETLSQFWTTLENMLWDRFHLIYEKNVASINQLVENDYKAVIQNKSMVSREKTSFLISKKLAQWITSIYRLDLGKKLEQDLYNLSKTYEGILVQMGKCSKNPKFGKCDHVLIVNCTDQILAPFIAYGFENKITELFANLLQRHVAQLLDELIQAPGVHMQKLIAFLSQAENVVAFDKSKESNRQALSIDMTLNSVKRTAFVHMESLISEFNNQWKNSLSYMYSQIMSEFSNMETGKSVMERAVAVWLHHFKRFERIVEAVLGRSSSVLISEEKVRYELKKYTQFSDEN